MKILVYSAGVLGCDLSKSLLHVGKDVTLPVRGKWAEEIEKNGRTSKMCCRGTRRSAACPL